MDKQEYTREEVIQLLKDCIKEWCDYSELRYPTHEEEANDYIQGVL